MWGPSNLLGLKQQHGEESFFPTSKGRKKKVDLAVLSHCKCLPKGKKEDYDASACVHRACVLNQSGAISGTNTDLVETCGPHGGPILLLMKVNALSPSNLCVGVMACVSIAPSLPRSSGIGAAIDHHHDSWSVVRSWHANGHTSAEMRRNRHTTKLQRLTHAAAFIHNLVQRYHKSTCRSIKPLIQSITSVLLSHTHPNWRTWVPRVRPVKWN